METMFRRHPLSLIVLAIAATLPGVICRLAQIHLDPLLLALVSGSAIMGASFLLVWACDAAQADISQALAIAVVALIAVLPEYAVDMYFTWQAGKFPESSYAQYSIANMTGANRLLIGVAWTVIAVIFWFKTRRPVPVESERRTELAFLGGATLYALVVTIKGSLVWYDGVVFVALYAAYMSIAARRPGVECEAWGPAALLVRLPKARRRMVTAALFLFAAGVILANAEPFCEGLIGAGKAFHVNEFLLVQWLAPLASEMPEFVVAIMFALRKRAGLALGSLLSAQLNQWTLLVGMIPGVFAVSHGSLDHPIPFSSFQINEVWLTAAQSLLAVAILAGMRFSVKHALLLFVLFAGQLMGPQLVNLLPGGQFFGLQEDDIRPLFAVVYGGLAVIWIAARPKQIMGLYRKAAEA
jgi:cation:H+ antiporter